MRSERAPKRSAEWEPMLIGELTADRAGLLAGGKLKDKSSCARVFKYISDYVIDNLNSALRDAGRADQSADELLYSFNRLEEMLCRVFFYRKLAFLDEKDVRALDRTVTDTVNEFADEAADKLGRDNIDVNYALIALRRRVNGRQ